MKHFIFIITITLLYCSCSEKKSTTPNHYLIEQLGKAEELRFSNPEISDTILTSIYHDLYQEQSTILFAKYYFIKAHVEMGQNNYAESALCMDSATRCDASFQEEYYAKILLFDGVINQRLLNYDKAKASFSELYHSPLKENLSNSGYLRLLFGFKTIKTALREDGKHLIDEARNAFERVTEKDLGYYYANLGVSDNDKTQARQLYKKAFNAYQQSGQCELAYSMLFNKANTFMNEDLDSTAYYLDSAMNYCQAHVNEACIYFDSRIDVFFNLIYSKYLYKTKEHNKAIEALQSAIHIAKELKLEELVFSCYKELAHHYYELGNYEKAMNSKDLALKYRLEYSAHILSSQIKYNDAKERVAEVKRENQYLKKSQRLKDRLFLTYSLIISLIAFILFQNRKSIKEMLNMTKAKVDEKENEIKQHEIEKEDIRKKTKEELVRMNLNLLKEQERLLQITDIIKDTPYKDKSKLNKIEDLVESTDDLSSWDVFNSLYYNKYPLGESKMRVLFPDLSEKEYQYLMCAHYGLSQEKMANIFSIKKESVRKRSQRIKKNLNINPNIDLRNYLYQNFQFLFEDSDEK